MNAITQSEPVVAHRQIAPVLRTLVLCDLADSTALVGRLGDQHAAELFRKHDRVVRTLLNAHTGREIDKTDGFLAMFERPIQAVAFALDYQRQLRQLSSEEQCALVARVGIHIGDVLVWDNAQEDIANGAKATEVEGLVKPIASRLMQLALPGQILLSSVTYSLAHRAQGELGERLATVRWRAHGRYRFKGVPDLIPVFEVGEEGLAPLRAPPWSGKAHREVPFWRRPAALAIESVLLLAAAAIPAWYLFKPAPAIAFANRDWVIVGDLKNLTGETKFDESLQAAFRIGLEQSRHVNVLSDLKTRETIKLMQRDPEKTLIDREVGSEIAIRDGARALILPTIAEIGGRVRVTAEVVDPTTQTTVYSESADGIGEQSVLPSLDKVNQQLRLRLGEALATVSSESKPLEKAATKNLEALRAYSLGRRAYNSGNFKEALALLQQAMKLDDDFALGRTFIANIYTNSGETDLALKELDRAMATRDRLSARDSLYVEALRARFEAPARALEKWKTLAKLYPDFSFASSTLAYILWQDANRFDDAIKATEDAALARTPELAWIEAFSGVLYLGNEQYQQADQHFLKAKKLGLLFPDSHASVYAAQRAFDKLKVMLADKKIEDNRGQDVSSQNARVSFMVDQGRWDDAWKYLEKSKSDISTKKQKGYRKLEAIEVSLLALRSESGANTPEVPDFIKSEQAALVGEKSIDRFEAMFRVLFASYVAAKNGDTKVAQTVLAQLGSEAGNGDYPILSRMLAVVQAEVARSDGRPEDAIRILQQLPLDGSELYLTHVALMDAYAAKGDNPAALAQARWLATHRGRAYMEYNADWVARPFNVAQSNLAVLREAELSLSLGDTKGAISSLDSFRRQWPDSKQVSFVSGRVESLQKQLDGRTG
ncbi:putative peptide modification system cyclase [Dokdonella sp.]|uniref:putative peptide modification system cyclase n=1 Tax=Dokdonella sp. TaxID=2291710 RepID=UPI002610F207|nr:putative peptide modification system cyclase [Dokdonella sp.]